MYTAKSLYSTERIEAFVFMEHIMPQYVIWIHDKISSTDSLYPYTKFCEIN